MYGVSVVLVKMLVGEGNFSFTSSLLKRMRALNKKYNILATSFDSREQLLSKYPETLGLINEMLKDANVAIRHDIDATNLAKSGISCCGKYTDIVFNFPHLGREDCNAHSSMLAHIMDRYTKTMNVKICT